MFQFPNLTNLFVCFDAVNMILCVKTILPNRMALAVMLSAQAHNPHAQMHNLLPVKAHAHGIHMMQF
jgi:hypothetical protein